jgi:ABC-type multidrug transport system fused ATPase/permease subunit
MKGVGAGTRVFDLLDRKSAIPLSVGKTLEPGREGPIRFENVSFTYPSRKEVEVLKGVDLQIEVGTSLAIAYVPPIPAEKSRSGLTAFRFRTVPQRPEWEWEIQHPSLDLPVLRS